MSALSMVTKMQPHSYSLGVIARELALDISDAIYEPQVASHTPGVANVAADALSRKFQPDKPPFALPPVLSACTEVHPVERSGPWWRTLSPQRDYTAEKQGGQRDSRVANTGQTSSKRRKGH